MDISGIIRVKKHSLSRFRFESFTFRQVKLEGSNHYPGPRKIEFALHYILGCLPIVLLAKKIDFLFAIVCSPSFQNNRAISNTKFLDPDSEIRNLLESLLLQ